MDGKEELWGRDKKYKKKEKVRDKKKAKEKGKKRKRKRRRKCKIVNALKNTKLLLQKYINTKHFLTSS